MCIHWGFNKTVKTLLNIINKTSSSSSSISAWVFNIDCNNWKLMDLFNSVLTNRYLSLQKEYDQPVKWVELHGQHGMGLQGGVWVVGRWSGLLTQLCTINGSRHQALQDLLRFRGEKQIWWTENDAWGNSGLSASYCVTEKIKVQQRKV